MRPVRPASWPALFSPAVPDRIGHHQATTARVCIGVVAYEIVTRSSDLATQEHALALAIAGTGQSASELVGQLQAYAGQLKPPGWPRPTPMPSPISLPAREA